jgi:hypothetical protein
MALRNIVEVGEKQQFVKLKVWMRWQWKDCMLHWDPSQFQNQTELMVHYTHVWTPDLHLFEGVSDEGNMPNMEDFRAEIQHTGTVSYNFPAIVTLSCQIKVAYFPFDHQVCKLTLASWIYSGQFLDLAVQGPKVDIDNFLAHAGWDVVDTKAVRHNIFYVCCPYPYPDITFYIHMRRKPTFFVVILIFPCFLINMLTFAGFLLPSFSGEKISLQVSLLLSITVFLLLVQDILPSSSEHFPVLAVYFANSMALVCVSSAFCSIVIHLYYKSPEDHQISPWIRKLFFEKIAKLVRVQLHSDMVQHLHNETRDPGTRKVPRQERDEQEVHEQSEWKDLSDILNRLLLFVYLCMTLVNTLYLIYQITVNHHGPLVKME